jgi:hypothetical protein
VAPKGSIYAGPTGSSEDTLWIDISQLTDPGSNNSVSTTLTFTQGIALNFTSALTAATEQRQNSTSTAVSIFDQNEDRLLKKNEENQKTIKKMNREIEDKRKEIEEKMKRIYDSVAKADSIKKQLKALQDAMENKD